MAGMAVRPLMVAVVDRVAVAVPWKALEQDQYWWPKAADGEPTSRQDLIELEPAHLVRLRAWLERNADRFAPPGDIDPLGWMRERPLYKRVVLLIEHPGEVGELIQGMLGKADLKTIKQVLSDRLKGEMDQAKRVAIKRVLWKIGAVERKVKQAELDR